jgi:hypothetical protein
MIMMIQCSNVEVGGQIESISNVLVNYKVLKLLKVSLHYSFLINFHKCSLDMLLMPRVGTLQDLSDTQMENEPNSQPLALLNSLHA